MELQPTLKKLYRNFDQSSFTALWLIIIAGIFLSSCANTTPHISSRNSTPKQAPQVALSKVILLPPLLQYESIATEETLSTSAYKGEEAREVLTAKSIAILQSKKCQIINAENLTIHPAYNDIISNRKKLFKNNIRPDITKSMKKLSESSGGTELLALLIKVKVGPRAFIDPIFSGATASGASYTRLKAVLYDIKTGYCLWSNEVQLLERPKPNDSEYIEAINLLYNNLELDTGGQHATKIQ